jgi:N4-gp56 family major capsid protein
MATGTSTSTQIPAPVQSYYDRILLERATPNLVHGMFGQQRPVKMNSGDQPKFRRYSSLPKANQPLTEGVSPSPQQASKTDVTGQLETYGAYVEFSDYVQYTSQDSVLTEYAEILGENAGESVDLVYRDTLVTGTSVFRANSVAARTDIVTGQSVNDYKKIVRALQNANAKVYQKNPIVGSDKVGTAPVWASYFAIIDPEAYYDLQALTGFVQTAEYPDGGKSAVMHEVGSLNHIRFVMTSEAKVWADGGGSVGSTGLASTGASNVDVHCALIFGMNAYGICPLQGKALENIVKPLGSAGSADALNQRGTSGWKAITDIVILNEAFMYRYEFGVTA